MPYLDNVFRKWRSISGRKSVGIERSRNQGASTAQNDRPRLQIMNYSANTEHRAVLACKIYLEPEPVSVTRLALPEARSVVTRGASGSVQGELSLKMADINYL